MLSHNNDQLGIMSFEEALARAEATAEDLVEVAKEANPPVCRMMDFGKFQYEQGKKEREQRKRQHNHKVKEVKFHPNIDDHDYRTKLNHAIAFLEKGDKVKFSMFFRGREMAHTGLGMELMERVVKDMVKNGTPDAPPRKAGRMITLMMSPLGSSRKS